MELGEPAYALLNVITGAASSPESFGLKFRGHHSLQEMAGLRLVDCSKQCRKGLHLDRYVKECNEAVKTSIQTTGQSVWIDSSHGLPRMWRAKADSTAASNTSGRELRIACR